MCSLCKYTNADFIVCLFDSWISSYILLGCFRGFKTCRASRLSASSFAGVHNLGSDRVVVLNTERIPG